NPDSRATPPRDLLRLARRLRARGGLLIIDEAFADFAPELCVAPLLAEDPEAGENLVVLRSFGKAYGLPGLPRGFAPRKGPGASPVPRSPRGLSRSKTLRGCTRRENSLINRRAASMRCCRPRASGWSEAPVSFASSKACMRREAS